MPTHLLQAATPEIPKSLSQLDIVIQNLIDSGISAGKHIIAAVVIFIVGRFLIKLINRLVASILQRRHIEISVQTFLSSLVNIILTILLIITVIGALGVNTTSFAALIASAGVAIGMALSGNLQNFAGGLIILLFKPYRVGDFIDVCGVQGTVSAVQIFHTILLTPDNKAVYLPNGSTSSSTITNYSREDKRRIEWTFGIDYGEDVNRARTAILSVITADARILPDPAPFVAVGGLSDSSVDIIVRVWVPTEEYWNVYFDMHQRVYETFNEQKINFPYPQQTVHLVQD
ncbi:MAG: mechanosensitive ion channel [Alloprevotella sp.]|nr:mechanosensitive ion channel [Bacteroidales bacterium]MDY2915186.1 mechanosensitive ion channel [Alloprevotella sp.]